MNDRGTVTLVMLAVGGLVMLLMTALVAVAGIQSARLRATTAADAAALAAAPVTFLPFGASGTPAQEAGRFAGLNGGVMLSCRCPIDRSFAGRSVEVRVRTSVAAPLLGFVTVEAVGRAEFVPAALLGG